MSKEQTPTATESQDSSTARVNISAKDAAAQLIPPGTDVSNLTPEQQMEMTSNMVQASTLHEKYTANMNEAELEVFNALLLVTPKDIPVKDRFQKALDTFSQVNKTQDKAEDKTVEQDNTGEKENKTEQEGTVKQNVAPKGEMDVSGTSASESSNLLTPESDSPLGNDDDYFEHLAKRFRQQTTMNRKSNL